MKLLIDTHAFLWFYLGDPRLSKKASVLIQNSSHTRFISLVTLWEISIKISIHKLDLGIPFDQFLDQEIKNSEWELLPLELAHLSQYGKLPLHHRDPFDRLLVAQAQAERATLITADPQMQPYAVPKTW